MSRLVLVRHGQASAHSADYDQLSPTGEAQAATLGAFWAKHQRAFDRVFVGTLKRHKQTLVGVQQAYDAAGLDFPVAEVLPGVDEYDAEALLREAIPQVLAREPALQEKLHALQAQSVNPFGGPLFWKLFMATTKMWVRGELTLEGPVPPWQEFQGQVITAWEQIRDSETKGEEVAVFTSGGPISILIGHSMQLDPIATLELSWRIFNSSLTTFLYSGERLSLTQMNTLPHIADETTWTLR